MFGGAEVPGGDAPKNLEGGVSFRFNFSVEGEENGPSGQQEKQEEEDDELGHRLASSSEAAATTTTTTTTTTMTTTTTTTSTPSLAPAFEIVPDFIDVDSLQLDAVDLGLPSGPILKVRVAGPDSLAHSDLVPRVYEGGFKLWEGAVDLARLLAEEVVEAEATGEDGVSSPSPSSSRALSLVPLDGHLPRWLPGASRPPSIHGARVLELGCGSALPSLAAAKAAGRGRGRGEGGGERRGGPVSVTLCDFNAEVLRTCTAANVAANFREGDEGFGGAETPPFFRYFAGDWSNLRSALEAAGALSSPSSSCPPCSSSSSPPPPGFDLILAAEVTYNPESYAALAGAIADLLAPPPARAAALVAAKRHYFGVGGNVDGFAESVTRLGRLRAERVAVVEGPLPRDVLLLTRVK